jgi:hypothetical protein
MTVKLSPEREREILAAYHANTAKIQAERLALEEMQAQQKAINEEHWRNVKAVTHRAKVPHECELCKGAIKVDELCHSRSMIINTSRVGWDAGWATRYRHTEGKCIK